MKLAIGLILSNGFPVPAPFFLSYAALQQHILSGATNADLPDPLKVEGLQIINAQGFPIDAARNEVCRAFLASDADCLLFLDADMTHPPNLAQRLISINLPLVTARYQMRKPPFATVAFRKIGPSPFDYAPVEDEHGVIPVDAAGAGALLIHRGVLERIHYEHTLDDPSAVPEWFRYTLNESGLRARSEDMWFFEQAAACGFGAWCDLDTVCGHVSGFAVDPTWAQPWKRAKAEADAKAARIVVP